MKKLTLFCKTFQEQAVIIFAIHNFRIFQFSSATVVIKVIQEKLKLNLTFQHMLSKRSFSNAVLQFILQYDVTTVEKKATFDATVQGGESDKLKLLLIIFTSTVRFTMEASDNKNVKTEILLHFFLINLTTQTKH